MNAAALRIDQWYWYTGNGPKQLARYSGETCDRCHIFDLYPGTRPQDPGEKLEEVSVATGLLGFVTRYE